MIQLPNNFFALEVPEDAQDISFGKVFDNRLYYNVEPERFYVALPPATGHL